VRSNCLQMIDETHVLKIKIQFLGAWFASFSTSIRDSIPRPPVLRGEQTRSDAGTSGLKDLLLYSRLR
jgi:hypothetical protein